MSILSHWKLDVDLSWFQAKNESIAKISHSFWFIVEVDAKTGGGRFDPVE